jgi:hypothetical protein
MPGTISEPRARRLFLVSPHDASSRLSLCWRLRLLQKIRSLIVDPDRAHMVPFNTTDLDAIWRCGSASPCTHRSPPLPARNQERLAAPVRGGGVAHPIGIEDLASVADLVRAIAAVRA